MPVIFTVSFGTIDWARPILATRRICLPVSVSCAPSTERNSFFTAFEPTFSSFEPDLFCKTCWMNP